MRIHEVLHGKSSQDVITISPDASVRELLALLAEHNVGALVVSRDGTLVDGIVSERDENALEGPVSGIMTAEVATCGPDTSTEELMALMTERRIRHVPVVRDGALSGIVSIGDVVKSRMSQLEFERDQLDSYVHQT
jgi:CBS domain-containing protein